MVEIWKDIPNYEKLYQASTLGRIRTHVDKTTYTEKHGIRHWKQRILKFKPSITTNQKSKQGIGYRVDLWKNGKHKDYLVARLILTTFRENLINTDMTVNHKNGNRLDNKITNLEWLSRADNIRYGFNNDQYSCSKKIKLFNKNTNVSLIINSMSKASKIMNKNYSYISCRLKRNSLENENYKWEILV